MKIQNSNKLSFQKELRANCAILKDKKSYPCEIYQLSPIDDVDYFIMHKRDGWEDALFWKLLKDNFKILYNNEKLFALEDNNRCLGLINISEAENTKDVIVIETQPQSKDKGYKYVGETLISFVVGLAKKDKTQQVTIPVSLNSAKDYYSNLVKTQTVIMILVYVTESIENY